MGWLLLAVLFIAAVFGVLVVLVSAGSSLVETRMRRPGESTVSVADEAEEWLRSR